MHMEIFPRSVLLPNEGLNLFIYFQLDLADLRYFQLDLVDLRYADVYHTWPNRLWILQ